MATGLSAEVPPEQWAMLKEPGLPLWGQSFEFPLGVGSSLLLGVTAVPGKRNTVVSGRPRGLHCPGVFEKRGVHPDL